MGSISPVVGVQAPFPPKRSGENHELESSEGTNIMASTERVASVGAEAVLLLLSNAFHKCGPNVRVSGGYRSFRLSMVVILDCISRDITIISGGIINEARNCREG